MTTVDQAASPAPADPDDPTIDPPLIAICPFLVSADGTWRSTTVSRQHRCGALAPPAPLAAEKQRRLCLTALHSGCATFQAARDTRSIIESRDEGTRRPVARTTPVVLDHGRLAVAIPALRPDRRSGQTVLIGLLGVAFGALILGRLTGGGGPGATERPTTEPAASSLLSPGPSGQIATNPPAATPGAVPSATSGASSTPATPRPSTTGSRTYKVKPGDTLIAIAARFDTTPKAIRKLNGLPAQTTLKVGQVLQIP